MTPLERVVTYGLRCSSNKPIKDQYERRNVYHGIERVSFWNVIVTDHLWKDGVSTNLFDVSFLGNRHECWVAGFKVEQLFQKS